MSSYSEIFMKEPTSCFSRLTPWYSTEHRDLQATAMSVDWSGQFVLLAGRRHLALQSLDKVEDDEDSLRKFYRNSKHEVSSAEWAICEHSQEYCALATSQLIEVITWRSGHPTLIHSLRAHTRVITDIDWHCKHPHLLASCSIDTFTHLWDLRDPRKPILSLSAVSGATQVGFNRVSGNLLATAHDGDLRIWDQRMGSCPIQYITAHLSRIHGINWSHYFETHLTTASQDGTVKYFDINNPRRAERIITTSSPVWRARYTPFADGLVTVIVPHLGRGENSLLLWNNAKQNAPICSMVGHTDVVLDFAWRPKRNNPNPDMELITWSRDQSVKVWRIDETLQKLCESPSPSSEDDGCDSSNRSTLPSKPSRNRSQPSCSLQHEFSLLNTNIPHIDVEVLDPIKRNATLRISVNGLVIMLQVTFPLSYPECVPDFAYCQGTSIDVNLSDSLMKVLKTSANQRTKNGRPCLEFCLRALVTAFKKAANIGDKTNIRLQSPRLEGALSGCVMDACVPFPKTSGARFNHVGILVTFAQAINSKGISLKHQNTTPRALSALSGGYLGNVMGSQPVLYAHHRDPNSTAFYLHDRVRKSSKNRGVLPKPSPTVLVYDVSKILFVSRDLAENYIIDSKNVAEMCRYNKDVAQQFGFPEIAQCWSLAEIVATSTAETESDDDMVFNQIPFPKNILESLILHYAQNFDIQTAAMLCCAFGRHCPPNELSRTSSLSNKSNQSTKLRRTLNESSSRSQLFDSHIRSGQRIFKQSGSPYHTILPVDSKINQSWGAALYKQYRSNSWSDSLDECRTGFELNRTILGDSQRHLYDNFKRAYSEMLYRWGLLVNRTKVLKYLSSSSETFRGVEFVTECIKCAKVTQAPMCRDCHKPLLHCSLCRLPVRGSANSCLFCGHGGHLLHMKQWFEKNEVCATGCGCFCLKESSKLVEL